MAFETKEQVLGKILSKEKPICPHCSQEMSIWEVPPIEVGEGLGWGTPYLFVSTMRAPYMNRDGTICGKITVETLPIDVCVILIKTISNACRCLVPWAPPVKLLTIRFFLKEKR